MGQNYIEITQEEMANLLLPAGFNIVSDDHNNTEVIYQRNFKSVPNLALRVYSSIRFGYSRSVGEDAIRIVLWDYEHNRCLAKAIRTHRVAGWENRIKVKIREMCKTVKIAKCPRCGNYLAERVKQINKSKFLGCTNFPNCKFTKGA